MEERKKCWLWLLAGLFGLALLGLLMNYTGKTSAKSLTAATRSLAQEGLDSAGFTFARPEVDGSVLRLVGTAPDKATAEAACKAAESKVAGRVGPPPSIFTAVDCAGLRYPGDTATYPSDIASSDTSDVSDIGTAVTSPVVPSATKADADTCQARLTEAGKSGSVSFARNKNKILAGQDILDRVAVIAKDCQKFAIEIGGHTDTGGAADLNQRLSDVRATSVRTYLINKGVAARQLTAKGFGETKPLVNDFPDGNADVPGQPDSALRAQNRRIEFTVTALQ